MVWDTRVSIVQTVPGTAWDIRQGGTAQSLGAPDGTPPTITGPGGSVGPTATLNLAENQTAVHTFTANESVTWTIAGGADALKFSIGSGTGALA